MLSRCPKPETLNRVAQNIKVCGALGSGFRGLLGRHPTVSLKPLWYGYDVRDTSLKPLAIMVAIELDMCI